MSTQSHRAVEKQAASFRLEEINRFSNQHGAMGRAHAPQRRSHHHRPVISFKDRLWCFVLGVLYFVSLSVLTHYKVLSTKLKVQSSSKSLSDTESRYRRLVLFRVRIGKKS